jgi:hypothetical protein
MPPRTVGTPRVNVPLSAADERLLAPDGGCLRTASVRIARRFVFFLFVVVVVVVACCCLFFFFLPAALPPLIGKA